MGDLPLRDPEIANPEVDPFTLHHPIRKESPDRGPKFRRSTSGRVSVMPAFSDGFIEYFPFFADMHEKIPGEGRKWIFPG